MSFYINFDTETGTILKFTNEIDNTSLYIETDKDTYVDFVTNKKNVDDYLILPSSSQNQVYELVAKHRDLLNFDVDKSIHQLTKTNNIDFKNGFIITQNTNTKTWHASFTNQLKEFLNKTSYYKDKTQYLYVTTHNDPNILLDSLVVPLWKILYNKDYEIENTDKTIAGKKDVSVYCGKVFDNYAHIQEEK